MKSSQNDRKHYKIKTIKLNVIIIIINFVYERKQMSVACNKFRFVSRTSH